MISVCAERLSDCLEELKPLFDPHWEELALDKDKVALDPQYEVYLERENRGEVLCVVVREGGRIIAYFVGFVAPGLHYKTCLTLTMDLFWVAPDFRQDDSLGAVELELVCNTLFDQVKKEALNRGVERVFYGSKLHRDVGAMFERMGMVEVERYYSAWLGD
jgi:hypothetical protein